MQFNDLLLLIASAFLFSLVVGSNSPNNAFLLEGKWDSISEQLFSAKMVPDPDTSKNIMKAGYEATSLQETSLQLALPINTDGVAYMFYDLISVDPPSLLQAIKDNEELVIFVCLNDGRLSTRSANELHLFLAQLYALKAFYPKRILLFPGIVKDYRDKDVNVHQDAYAKFLSTFKAMKDAI